MINKNLSHCVALKKKVKPVKLYWKSYRHWDTSSSISCTCADLELWQCCPLQSPHAATQAKPYFLQVQRLLPHGFFASFLHLHRMNLSKWSGAIGLSVVMGIRMPSSLFQPHLVGSKTNVFNVCHTIIWRWTLILWYFAAPSVGGNFPGTRPQNPVVIIPWNFEHLTKYKTVVSWEKQHIS